MNQKKRLNRRIILSSLLLIVVCSIFSSQSSEKINNTIDYNVEQENPSISVFEGAGRSFQVNQYATAISSTFDVNPTTTASFTLTQGWTAENITITAENTSRYRNLIRNGEFNDYISSHDPYPYWDWYSNTAFISNDNRSSYMSIDVATDQTTPDPVGGNLYAGDMAYFYQTVSVDEEENPNRVVELSFDTRIYSTGRYNAMFYAAVIIDGVEYNYTRRMSTMTASQWYYNTLTWYLDDEGQSLPGDITFRLGTYVDGIIYWSYQNDQHFDNVEFNIYTYVDEPYALRARDMDTYTDYYYENTSAGQGIFTIDVQKSYTSTQDVQFSISKNVSLVGSVTIDNLTISADLKRTINSSSSSFQDGEFPGTDDILWTFDAAPSIPVSYTNRWIEIEKPADWEIISTEDPFLTNRTSSCLNLEYGTTKFIIPTGVFSNGDWQIRARSKSWFDDAKLEYWNGASFEERTEFYVNDNFRFKVDINDTVTFANTLINFTLYHPNGTVLWEESEEPSSVEYYFGNFTIGTYNMSVGTYTGEVAWTNNLSSSYVDKVGYKTFEFDVIHHTSFTAINPNIETVPGEALLILVTYEDTDLNQGIDLATVEYNSTFGQTGSLQYAGGGYYFLDLDTSALDYTDYYLSLNASKSYYDNHTESDFVHLSIEREGMILDVPRQVNSVSANSYALFDFNLTGEISEAFLSTNNITTDWIAPYSIVEQSLGQYQLNVSTWGVTSGSFPETYIINIMANKTNYSDISDVVLLRVNPIASYITANDTFVEVSQGTPFSIRVNLTDTGLGTLVSGADCTATWSLGTTITPNGDEFVIDYETTGLDLDQYSSLITINRSGYQTKSVIISVLINPVQTVIATNISFIRVSQGSQFTVKVNYTEYYGGAIIPAATCTVDWSKYYEINPVADGFEILFNTTDLSLDQYTATVQINKTGFETKNVFITVLVDPISTIIEGNETLVQVEQGKVFSINVNYTDFNTGLLIAGANCIVTWGRDTNTTEVFDEFVIDFDTTG